MFGGSPSSGFLKGDSGKKRKREVSDLLHVPEIKFNPLKGSFSQKENIGDSANKRRRSVDGLLAAESQTPHPSPYMILTPDSFSIPDLGLSNLNPANAPLLQRSPDKENVERRGHVPSTPSKHLRPGVQGLGLLWSPAASNQLPDLKCSPISCRSPDFSGSSYLLKECDIAAKRLHSEISDGFDGLEGMDLTPAPVPSSVSGDATVPIAQLPSPLGPLG